MIVEHILKYLSDQNSELPEVITAVSKDVGIHAEHVFKRQFLEEREKRDSISGSNCGRCPRQLAYKRLGFEENGKEIDSRSILNFFFGDITELAVVHLARLSCPGILSRYGMDQSEAYLEIEGIKILVHPDGIYTLKDELNPETALGEQYLVEVKSMNSYSFDDFEKGEIDDSYIAQVNFGMEALKLDKCIFIALNKNSGVLSERLLTRDGGVVAKIKENVSKALLATKTSLPERVYTINDKKILGFKCLYCPFWKTCWENHVEKVLVGKSYKLKMVS